uniref:Protein kinase domain-containing protein n=1 Tax=Arcella intermedia TaxID=1963864 RepID=A0A6B2L113_9EUKA
MFNMKVVECNQNICVVEVSDLSLISTGHVKIENSIWKKAHDKPTLSIEVLADNQELYYDLFAFVLEVFTKISKNAKLHIQSFWKCNSNSFNLPSNYEISVTETEEKFLRGNADNEKGIGLIIPEIVIPEFNGNKYPFEALKIREKDKQREYSTATLEVGKAEPKHVLVKEFQPGQRLEFRKEIVNHSEHPNIETIHGIVYFPPCIILEDFPLGDLNTLLQKREIYLSWEWKIQVLLDIARALEHLHGSVIPVAHRLVRTENIMITSLDPTHPCAKLANFRNSLKVRYFIKEIPPKVHFTETRWLAPEILSGEPYDTKVDIYAFGYICWDLITRETSYDMDANIPQLIQEEKYHKMKNKILHNEIISLLNAAWTKSPWDSIIKALEILKSKEKIESFEKENKKNYDNYLRQPFIKVQYAGIAKLFHKPTNEYYCTIKYDNVVLYTPALHSHIPHWNQSYTINTKNQAEEVEFQIFMRDREGLGSLQFIGKSNTTIEFSRTQDVNLQVINNRSVVGELHIQIHPPSK